VPSPTKPSDAEGPGTPQAPPRGARVDTTLQASGCLPTPTEIDCSWREQNRCIGLLLFFRRGFALPKYFSCPVDVGNRVSVINNNTSYRIFIEGISTIKCRVDDVFSCFIYISTTSGFILTHTCNGESGFVEAALTLKLFRDYEFACSVDIAIFRR